MKEKGSTLLVLQVGTTKLVALRACLRPDRTLVVESWGKRDARGFEKGLVRDSEVATQEVRALLEEVAGTEKYGDFPLYGVISNPEIRSYQVSSSLYFQGNKTIGEYDRENVIKQVKTVATVPLDEVILLTVPQEYLVNDLPEIRNPVGLEGKRLGVTLHLFTMPVTALRGLTLLLDRLEIEAELLIPRGLASSALVLNEDEKKEGVLLLEIGGHLSELFYFYQGTLQFSKIIPWGGEHITELITREWEIPPREARHLKEEFGTLEGEGLSSDETIPCTDASGRIRLKIPAKLFQEVILRNMELGFQNICGEVRGLKTRFPHLYQLVLSGGATKMDGFLELLQSKLDIPSRLGFSTGIQGPQELLVHPAYHAVVGLLKYVAGFESDGNGRRENPNLFSKTVSHVKNWIQDYF